MLTDIKFDKDDPMMDVILKSISGGKPRQRLAQGGYLSGHWSIQYETTQKLADAYPAVDEEEFYSYGVCDSYQQLLEKVPLLLTSKRKFFVGLVEIRKDEQPDEGGWRWHKWGVYIGTQDPTCEYIHDEPDIKVVYTYHVYEVLE